MVSPSSRFHWLTESMIAPHLMLREQAFFQAACVPCCGDWILTIDTPSEYFQAACLPKSCYFVQQNEYIHQDIVASAGQMPWCEHEFDWIVAAHVLDGQPRPYQATLLAEWYRICKSQVNYC